MQIEAIYNQGRIEFPKGICFAHPQFKVRIDVPDDEIVNLTDPSDLPRELRDQAKAMLAEMAAIRNAPLLPDEELPVLTPKHLQNIEAFELRAQMRAEQGRQD